MSNHAIGPWQVVPELDDDGNMTFCLILNDARKEIANTANGNFGDEQEFANAYLIASAPDMIKALQNTFNFIEHYHYLVTDYEERLKFISMKLEIEKVIKKAKGLK